MRSTQKRLLCQWEKEKKDKKRVCHSCRRKFKSGKGYGGGGHVNNNIHNFRDGRKTKRNHHRDLPSRSSSNSCYYHHDYVDDYENDFEDFTVMNRLRTLGFTGASAHQISRTRRKYMCNTCSEVLPTFHAVVCHVKEDDHKDGKQTGAEVDDEKEEGEITAEEEADEKEEGEISAEEEADVKEDDEVADVEDRVGAKASTEYAKKCESGGSMNQEVSTSDPPKRLDFDLNEMPPPED